MSENIYTNLPPAERPFRKPEKDLPVIIQTNNRAVVEWLRRRGITGRVMERVSPRDVEGKHLIASTAPVWVIQAAAWVSYVKFEPGRIDTRSADELEQLGAELVSGKFIEF